MDDLPTEYDAIIVGTGMIESIVAAAFSRIGKKVLHLDRNEYYGEDWASFNLEGLETWISQQQHPPVDDIKSVEVDQFIDKEEEIVETKYYSNIQNVVRTWFNNETDVVDQLENEAVKPKWTVEEVKNEYRKFNLDLSPKMLFSRGQLVELLISSNIARYAEFKNVSRVLTWLDGHLEPVPCSRADVFATRNVSVVQKRMLVKVLTMFAEYPDNAEAFQGFEDKTLLEYLKQRKLPPNLVHYIEHAIAMATDKTPCLEGVAACKAFLQSLGRYGNTPFIFPMYGCGEMPQCFCRLCAVFGGVYHLKRGVDCLVLAGDQCRGVVSGGRRLGAAHVVLSASHAPRHYLAQPDDCPVLQRAIFITDGSILPSDKEQVTLLRFPPTLPSTQPATVIELGPATHVAPAGLHVVHVTAPCPFPLDHVREALFQHTAAPSVLFSLTWEVKQHRPDPGKLPRNVRICSGPDAELDFDSAIREARQIFKELCPDEEFLPRAPDPDEIVMDEAEEPKEGCGGEGEVAEEPKEPCGGEGEVAEEQQTGGETEETETVKKHSPVETVG